MAKLNKSNLSLLRGKDFELLNNVHIKHPTLSDIEEMGEEKYSELCSCLSSTSLDVADILCFDLNIWYEDIKDEWEFFLQKCLGNHKDISVLIKFSDSGKLDFQEHCMAIGSSYRDSLNFFLGLSGEYIVLQQNINGINQNIIYNVKPFLDNNGNTVYYILDENFVKFTKFFYESTVQFINDINWIKKDYQYLKGGTKGAKKYILKQTLYNQRKKVQRNVITLESITSSLIAKGMSFESVWNLPIYTLYNIYYRLLKIDEYDNTMIALYNGCIDTKKNPINWEKINWATVIS